MPYRTATSTAANVCIGVVGSAAGFIFEHAGTFASVATGLYMVLCAVEKWQAIRKKKLNTKE